MDLLTMRIDRKQCAALIALPLTAAAIAVVSTGKSDAAVGQAPTTTPATVADSGTYSILSGARTELDSVKSWRLAVPPVIKVDLDQAKVIDRTGARTTALIPSDNGPCIATHYTSGAFKLGCPVPGGESAAVTYTGSFGVVSDAVKSVVYSMTDGTEQTSIVEGNLWKAPLEAKSVTYSENGQEHSVELMPRSSLPANATISPDGSTVTIRDAG